MPTEDLNIESKLKFSKRLGGLAKGHQLEMQQVLEDNEDLQMLVEQLLKENATLKSQLAEEKSKNTQLLAEIQELRNRPVQTNTYIENEYISEQHNYSVPRTSCTNINQLSNTNFTQL